MQVKLVYSFDISYIFISGQLRKKNNDKLVFECDKKLFTSRYLLS